MSLLRALLKWTVALLMPFALVMLGVRLLLTPAYLQLEYRAPAFPADEYGFTTAERLHWGTLGMRYLLNDDAPSYLADLLFGDGEPVFSAGEVSHMRDVKVVVTGLLLAWYATLFLMAALGLVAWRSGWLATYGSGARMGGLLTLAIATIAAMLGTVGASGAGDVFWEFFSGFHRIFFSGDSWLFAYSDTLIRLYPLRFWQDSVLYVGLLAASGAALLAFAPFRRPRGHSTAG